MKRNKPLALVAGAALLTLAACGGGGSESESSGSGSDREFGAQEGGSKDAERQGPAEEIDGATARHTHAVQGLELASRELEVTRPLVGSGASLRRSRHRRQEPKKSPPFVPIDMVPHDLSRSDGRCGPPYPPSFPVADLNPAVHLC